MDKSRTLIILVALMFLGFIAYNKYSLPLDAAMISPGSFYRGVEGGNISPREYYNQLHGLVYTEDTEKDCNVVVLHASNPVPIGEGGTVMFSSSKNKNDADSAGGWEALIGPEGEGCFRNGDKIIKPNSGGDVDGNSFKNSNMRNSSLKDSYSDVDIEVLAGNQVIIVFENVKCWWCHAHNTENCSSHSQAVGNHSQSVRSKVFAGDEIGIANDNTKVKVYKVPDELLSNGKDVFDIDDITKLQQVHSGKYFSNGELVPYSSSN